MSRENMNCSEWKDVLFESALTGNPGLLLILLYALSTQPGFVTLPLLFAGVVSLGIATFQVRYFTLSMVIGSFRRS